MTSPHEAPDNGNAVPPLDRLHRQALAGEVSAVELGQACLAHIFRAVLRRCKADPLLRDIDMENYASRVLTNVVIAVGGKDAQAGLFPEVKLLTAYLNRAVENQLNTVYGRRSSGREPLTISINAPVTTEDGGQVDVDLPDPRVAIDVDGVAAKVAYAQALRRSARLRVDITAGGLCPFHPSGPCPHATPVADLVLKLLRSDGELTPADIADEVFAVGRTLSLPANRTGAGNKRQAEPPKTLSDHDHTLDRHFRRCFEWWWYRAFVGTELDPAAGRPAGRKPTEPSSAADPLRLPIVKRLRVRKNGEVTDWQSGTCSLEGAQRLILPDQEFWRLLFTYKPDVYDYLDDYLGRKAD